MFTFFFSRNPAGGVLVILKYSKIFMECNMLKFSCSMPLDHAQSYIFMMTNYRLLKKKHSKCMNEINFMTFMTSLLVLSFCVHFAKYTVSRYYFTVEK